MNQVTLKFHNPIQEQEYRAYIARERETPLKFIVSLQSFNEFIVVLASSYYHIQGLNGFEDAKDYIIFQSCVCLVSCTISVLRYLRMIGFKGSLVSFIVLNFIRLVTVIYVREFWKFSLQFFSAFQLGYSFFLIQVISKFSYDLVFKVGSLVLQTCIMFFLSEFQLQNLYTAAFVSLIMSYKIFADEKTIREDFLVRQKLEKWMLIIDKIIPSSVFISKFNSREEAIELQLANQKARVQYNIKNSEQFNTFIAKTFLDQSYMEIKTYNSKGSPPPNNLKMRIRNLIDKEKIDIKNKEKKQQQQLMMMQQQQAPSIPRNSLGSIFAAHNRLAVSKTLGSMQIIESKAAVGQTIAESFEGELPNSRQNNSNFRKRVESSSQRQYEDHSQQLIAPQTPLSANPRKHKKGFLSGLRLKTNLRDSDSVSIALGSPPRSAQVSVSGQQRMASSDFRQSPALVAVGGRQSESGKGDNSVFTPDSSQHQSIKRGRKKKTMMSKLYAIKNQKFIPSEKLIPDGNSEQQQSTNNQVFQGFYHKNEMGEPEQFQIKLYSYYLEDVYVIIVIDNAPREDRVVRELNRLRDFQVSSNRLLTELGCVSRKMFSDLRSAQISYLQYTQQQQKYDKNTDEKSLIANTAMCTNNLRAINQCFALINTIDNFMMINDKISHFIPDTEIKPIDLPQLLDNLYKVVEIFKFDRQLKYVLYNSIKKSNALQSSSKYLTQILYNILSLSFQLCADNGIVQMEITSVTKSLYSNYIEVIIKHTIRDEMFSIFNFTEPQRVLFESSKKILELISPYSKFFIKQHRNFYAQIKFYLYQDLNDINRLTNMRSSFHSTHATAMRNEHQLIEQEDVASDEMSLFSKADPDPVQMVYTQNKIHENDKNQSLKKATCKDYCFNEQSDTKLPMHTSLQSIHNTTTQSNYFNFKDIHLTEPNEASKDQIDEEFQQQPRYSNQEGRGEEEEQAGKSDENYYSHFKKRYTLWGALIEDTEKSEIDSECYSRYGDSPLQKFSPDINTDNSLHSLTNNNNQHISILSLNNNSHSNHPPIPRNAKQSIHAPPLPPAAITILPDLVDEVNECEQFAQ